MDSAQKSDWREISKAASRELDSDKLLNLVSELLTALDSRNAPAKPPSEP